jgi:hypothetical protein
MLNPWFEGVKVGDNGFQNPGKAAKKNIFYATPFPSAKEHARAHPNLTRTSFEHGRRMVKGK